MAPFPPTASCVLPMNAHKYYAIQDTPSFRSLLAQVMDQEVEVLDVWYKEDTKCEKVINRPDYDKWVPKIGRRFVKPDDIAFIDITEYAPRSQTTSPYHMKIKSILPLLGDRVSIERVVVISEVSAETCRHTITGDVTVRVPGLGRMVERYVMTNTVAAMNMLHTVVDRYMKVQAQLAEEIPAELPGHLNTLLQEPFSDEESQASAQTVATATGEAESSEVNKAVAATADSKRTPTSKALERQTTKYFDADEELLGDEEQMLDEEEVQSIIEVMSVDEDDVMEAGDDVTGDVAAEVSPKKRHGIHIHGPDHPRGERTKKFFTELHSLSLSRRRFEAEAQVQALRTGSEMSEEASRWNRDKERWDKLWRGAKVRAAPIPKALAFLWTPLHLDKLGSRRRSSRIHPGWSEEGTPPGDASAPEEATLPGKETSSGTFKDVKSSDTAQQPPLSQEDAAFLEQQAPGLPHTSSLLARMRLKREMKRQHDK